jgi:hypothetical protein
MTLSGRGAVAVVAALVLSLALNAAWMGYLGSTLFRDRGRGFPAERLVALGARSLPEPLRERIAAELEPHGAELRSAFRDVRDARRAVFEAMRAEPFDRAAVEAAFADLRAKLAAVAAIGQTAMLAALEEATPEMRADIKVPPPRVRPDAAP